MRAFATARGVLNLVTVLLGAATAVLLVVLVRPAPATIEVNTFAQLVMSVFVPFLGVLTVQRADGRTAQAMLAAIARSLLIAGGFAAYGVIVSAVAGASVGQGPDARVLGQLILASVAVQALAQLTGTGFGLLVRRPVLAGALTIVVPLGVSVALTLIDPSGSLRDRATPFGGATTLLALTPNAWPGWLAIAGCWGLGLNALALLVRHAHRRPS